eukprot:231244_1
MDAESKRVHQENQRMRDDLAFHEKQTEKLQAENERLRVRSKKLLRFRELSQQSEEVAAKRGVKQEKKIKELSEKGRQLDQSLQRVLTDFARAQQQWESKATEQLQKAERETAELKHRAHLQDRELRTVRTLAREIVEQRSEVEQFFLESLEQIKQEILKEKQNKFEVDKKQYQEQMNQFRKRGMSMGPSVLPKPPAKTLSGALKADRESILRPNAPPRHLTVSEMSLADRERVLKLLFAKITHSNAHAHGGAPPASVTEYRPGDTFVTERSVEVDSL